MQYRTVQCSVSNVIIWEFVRNLNPCPASSTLHFITLHGSKLNCTALYWTVLYCSVVHCTKLHCTALHCHLSSSYSAAGAVWIILGHTGTAPVNTLKHWNTETLKIANCTLHTLHLNYRLHTKHIAYCPGHYPSIPIIMTEQCFLSCIILHDESHKMLSKGNQNKKVCCLFERSPPKQILHTGDTHMTPLICHVSPDHHSMQLQSQEVWWFHCGRCCDT